MANLRFEKVKVLHTLSKTSNSQFELSLVKWNNNEAKYDLRKWGDDGKKPYKGITFNKDELLKIYNILKDADNLSIDANIFKNINSNTIKAIIYKNLGEFKHRSKLKGYVTYTSWGGPAKIDIRCWDEDFKTCSKGVTLSEKERASLVQFLSTEFNSKENNIDFDTSEIDDLLFL